MAGVIENIQESVFSFLEDIISSFSSGESSVISVFFLSIVVALVSMFIWKFYRSLSRRNLININLSKYNKYKHPVASKFFATLLYLIEYIIIMPLLIVLWFSALAAILFLVADQRTANEILLISAALVGAVRILAYYKSEIARDVAKLFPFIALSLFLLSPGVFDAGRVLTQVSEVPLLFNNIIYFILVVSLIEIVLRLFYSMRMFLMSADENIGEEGVVIEESVDGK